MTAQGKITASKAIPGTIVRIVKESDATAELFEREPEFTAARIKRGSTLAKVIENIALGGGKRRLVTKFGDVTVVGHQTFILAKDGENEDELPKVQDKISAYAKKHGLSEKAEQDMRDAEAEVRAEIALPEPTFTISEEEIEENRRIREADAIRADEEMRLIEEARAGIAAAQDAIEALELPSVDEKKAEEQIKVSRALLDSPEPWEAKRHAKRTAEMWAHVVRLRSEFKDAPDWRKERITAALAGYGTVVYPEGTPEHTEYSAGITAALSEWKTTGEKRWIVQFERIGRFEKVKPLYIADFETPEAIERQVRRYAEKFLSTKFGFSIEFEGNRVLLDGGRFGSGTFAPEE